MLLNPFTPSEIASTPDLFFGRQAQLSQIESSLAVGSVLIQGAVGIGKSSLLARSLDLMAAAGSDFCTATMNASIGDVEAAARVLLDSVIEFTGESPRPLRVKVGMKIGWTGVEPTLDVQKGDLQRDYGEGRYLAVLQKILIGDHRRRRAANRREMILGIDEGDKAAAPVAQVVRSVMNHVQQQGVRDVRFVVAGVSPIHQRMTEVDQGISRFFNRTITLEPLSRDDSDELMTGKLKDVVADAEASGSACEVDPAVITRVVALAGGHPHVLQLLGSHLIQHENDHPDGRLGLDDLIGGLQRVCYEDRGHIYASLLHSIENGGKLYAFKTLLGLTQDSPQQVISEGYPTTINRQLALKAVNEGDIQWFVEQGILIPHSSVHYGLADQFIRVRLVFDDAGVKLSRSLVEEKMIKEDKFIQAGYSDWEQDEAYSEE